MPRDASGTYTTPVNSVDPAVTTTIISSADFNALTADLTTEMTDSFDRSGKGAMLADMAMGGFKITNVGAPVSSTDAARKTDLTLGGDVTGTLGVNTVSKIAGTSVTGTTGTGNVVLDTTPTISTPHLVGLSAGSFQGATFVGEVITANAAGVTLATSVAKTIASIALTKGNWYICSQGRATGGAGCVMTQISSGISSVTNNLTNVNDARGDVVPLNAAAISWYVPGVSAIVSINATTTYYLIVFTSFTGGSCTGGGTITAMRIP